MTGRRRRAVVALGLALATAAAACSSGGSGADPKPHPLPGSVTSVIDYSHVTLPKAEGTTTTTPIAQTGTATISGSVTGPGGLLPGATVRIERLVGATPARTDVTTGPDGRFTLPNVPGGRYRVRAFLAPSLALVTPDVRFLEDGKPATFDLKVDDQRAVVARAGTSPGAPYLGDDVNLAVLVAQRTVDADGIVRSTPLPGLRVELTGLGAWDLQRARPTRTTGGQRTTTTTSFDDVSTVRYTDAGGQVLYAMSCDEPGTPGLALLVAVTVTTPGADGQPGVPTQQTQRLPLDVPACIDPSSITVPTTDAADTSTTAARSTGGGDDGTDAVTDREGR